MKKIIWLCFCLPLFLSGCDTNNEPESPTVEMKFYTYTMYKESLFETASSRIYFFEANNGEQFREERIYIPEENYSEYWETRSEIYDMLVDGETELIDGTRVKAFPINSLGYLSLITEKKGWYSLSDNIIDVPKGRYYIMVKISDGDWSFMHKYMAKYITVSDNMSEEERTVRAVLYSDSSRKGYVDWRSE